MSILLVGGTSLHAQINGNTITGVVYGLDRRPLTDVYVELLDDLYRTVGQTRTDGLGSYSFSGVGTGNITIRARPFMLPYQEQEQSIEIRNAYTVSGVGGYSMYQQDFYLKLRKGVDPAAVAVFIQDVPKEAEKLYEKAVDELGHKRTEAALEHLRAAIGLFPKYFAALELLANEYVKAGRPETTRAAEVLYRVAVEVNPRAHRSFYGLAYSLYSMERHAEALVAAKQAVDLNAAAFDSVMLYGVLLRQAKKFQDAERQLIKARDLSGNTPRIHWELALLYGNDMKRFADAARELKLFLKAQPDSRDAANIKKLIAEFENKAKNG
jgi:tetratricopeptide (TPR) repeat protein